jgi:hypothetical protein
MEIKLVAAMDDKIVDSVDKGGKYAFVHIAMGVSNRAEAALMATRKPRRN